MACLLCGSFGNEEDLILFRNKFSPSQPNNSLNEDGLEKAVSFGRSLCHLLNLPEDPYVQAFLRSEICYCQPCTQIVKTVRDLFIQLDEIQNRISEYKDVMQEQLLRAKENMKFHPISLTGELRDNILEDMCLVNEVRNEIDTESAPQFCGVDFDFDSQNSKKKLKTRGGKPKPKCSIASSVMDTEADTNSNCEIETTIVTEFMDPCFQSMTDASSLGLPFQAVQTGYPEAFKCNDCGYSCQDIDTYVTHVRQHFRCEQPQKPTPKKSKKPKSETQTDGAPKKAKNPKAVSTEADASQKKPKKSKGKGTEPDPPSKKAKNSNTGMEFDGWVDEASTIIPTKPKTETGTATPKKHKKSKKPQVETETETKPDSVPVPVPSEGKVPAKKKEKSDLPRPKKEYICRFCGKMLSKNSTLRKHEMFQHKPPETSGPESTISPATTQGMIHPQATVVAQSQPVPVPESTITSATKLEMPQMKVTEVPVTESTITPPTTHGMSRPQATVVAEQVSMPVPVSVITTTTKPEMPHIKVTLVPGPRPESGITTTANHEISHLKGVAPLPVPQSTITTTTKPEMSHINVVPVSRIATTTNLTMVELPRQQLSFPLHKCSICGWSFITAQFLNDHVKLMHQGLRCTICDVYFSSEDELKKHKDSRHGSQTIKCIRCWFECSNSAEFQAHFQHCFIPIPAFFCEPCGVRFGDNETFQSHVAGHGRKEEQTKCESGSAQSVNLTSL